MPHGRLLEFRPIVVRVRRFIGSALGLCAVALLCASCVKVEPVVPLTSLQPGGASSWADWYQTQTGQGIDPDLVGAYAFESIGSDLYIGMGGSAPNDINGSLIARVNSGQASVVGLPYEQGLSDFVEVGGKILSPGSDPRDSWRAGNLYEVVGSTMTKYRNRIEPARLVAETTTAPDGTYEFVGVKQSAYQVRFIPPAGKTLTVSQDKNRGRSSQASSGVSDPDPTKGYADVCGPGADQFTPWQNSRIDAGMVDGSSSIVAAPGPADPTGFAGQSSISGVVWFDQDGDGTYGTSESGQAGARVELWSKDPYFSCHIHHQSAFVDQAESRVITAGAAAGRAPFFEASIGTNDWSYLSELPQDRAMSITRFGDDYYAIGYTFPPAQNQPSTRKLWRSTDGAQTWAEITGFQPDFALKPFEFDGKLVVAHRDLDKLVLINPGGTIHSTINLGFEMPTFAHDGFAVVCPSRVYTIDVEGAVRRSSDLVNWETFTDVGVPLGAIHHWDGDESLVVAERGGEANIMKITTTDEAGFC